MMTHAIRLFATVMLASFHAKPGQAKGCNYWCEVQVVHTDGTWSYGGQGTVLHQPYHLFLLPGEQVRIVVSATLMVCSGVLEVWENDTLVSSTNQAWNFEDTLYFPDPGKYFVHMTLSSNMSEAEMPACIAWDYGVPSTLSCAAFLDGPYDGNTGLMRDDLRSLGTLQVPYSVPPAVLATNGNNAIVDDVTIEIRPSNEASEVVMRLYGLVQRDGDIVDQLGNGLFEFLISPGDYHIAVTHSNHLGVMTAIPLQLPGNGPPTHVDFRDPSTLLWGYDAARVTNGTQRLWAGNASNPYYEPRAVKYVGFNNDRDPVLVAIGGTTPTNVLVPPNYQSLLDVNMDGIVKYTGANNDRDIMLQTIGGTVPTAVRYEQLP